MRRLGVAIVALVLVGAGALAVRTARSKATNTTTSTDAKPHIRVVNMIPLSMSAEHFENSEPNITAHPTDRSLVIGSAFTIGSFCAPRRFPLFVSQDTGETWAAACVVPIDSSLNPMDITVRFSGDGSSLYVGYMVMDTSHATTLGLDAHVVGFRPTDKQAPLNTLIAQWTRTPVDADSLNWERVALRRGVDQPYVQTSPVPTSRALVVGADDRALVGKKCNSGSVYYSPDPFHTHIDSVSGAQCVALRVDGSFGPTPAVRTVVDMEGSIYALFYRPIGIDLVDVVVSRYDVGTNTVVSQPFQALRDQTKNVSLDSADRPGPQCPPHDGLPGFRVARCRTAPFSGQADSLFGQQRRIESQLSIAAGPSTAGKPLVVIAFADSTPGDSSHLTLRFASSDDRGASWKHWPFHVPNGTNPALAVRSDGTIGLLYQKLARDGTTLHWQTWLAVGADGFASPDTFKLADAKANLPVMRPQPYLGEYIHLEARGNTFYGIFSASNDRTTSTFWPNFGVQRRYMNGTPIDLQGKPVPVSIDPYFVRVTP